jgi:hypothetical protein
MNRIPPGDVSQGETSFFLFQVAVLAVVGARLGALCLCAVAVWGLTSNLGLTMSPPWPDGPLSNWMVWLGLATVLHGAGANTHPSAWRGRDEILFGRLTRLREEVADYLNLGAYVARAELIISASLAPDKQQIPSQFARGGR